MKHEIIKVYAGWETVDDFGRHGKLIIVSSDKAAVNKAVEKMGWWGGPGDVQDRTVIKIKNIVYLLDEEYYKPIKLDRNLTKEEKRNKALSKLTKEEKELLGLNED